MGEREPSHGVMEVYYVLQGDESAAETGFRSVYTVPIQWNTKLGSECLPLSVLMRYFPIFGTYHFRLKVADTYGLSDYTWLDLGNTTGGNEIDVLSLVHNLGYNADSAYSDDKPKRLFVRVLPLSFDATDTQLQSYEAVTKTEGGMNWADDDLGDPIPMLQVTKEGVDLRCGGGDISSFSGNEHTRSNITTASVTNVGSVVKSIAKMGLGKAKKVVKQVNNSSMVGRSSPAGIEGTFPSVDATCALQELASLLDESFESTLKPHIMILEEVWVGLFPGEEFPFHHPSPRWLYAGFKSDIILESNLHTTGLLTLTSVAFFAKKHPSHVSRILKEQSEHKQAGHYPFAVVACKLTLMLADVFALRGGKFARTKAQWWDILSSGVDGYYEIFCWTFLQLDLEWERRQAVKNQFTSIMNTVKLQLEDHLMRKLASRRGI